MTSRQESEAATLADDAGISTAQAGEIPTPVEGLLDINLLPDRYRPRWPAPATVLAWLVAVALLVSLFLSYRTYRSAVLEYEAQRAALEAAQQQLEAEDSLAAELEALRADIEAAQQQAAALQRSADALAVQEIGWGTTLNSILSLAPDGLEVTSVVQSEDTVALQGTAEAYYLPLAYAAALRDSHPQPLVTVQEIHVLVPETEQELTSTPAETEASEAAAEQLVEANYAFSIRLVYPRVDAASQLNGTGGAP